MPKRRPLADAVLTLDEAAALIRVSPRSLVRLCQAHGFPMLTRRSWVDAWIAQRTFGGALDAAAAAHIRETSPRRPRLVKR